MKHTIDGQIVRLSADHGLNEVVLNLAGSGNRTFVVPSEQIAAFAVPVSAPTHLTIESPVTVSETSPPLYVEVFGRISKVALDAIGRPMLTFLPHVVDPAKPTQEEIILHVPLDVAQAFGGRLGEAATITITPVG